MSSSRTSPPAAAGHPTRFAAAFARQGSAIDGLPDEELLAIDCDIPKAACLAIDAVPRINALRERLLTFPDNGPFRHVYLDVVEDAALAAAHAHARYLAAVDPRELLEQALTSGHPLRTLLAANTHVLVLHGVVEHQVARQFSERHGYQDVAGELLALVRLWYELLPRLGGKTLVTELHLIRAECVADQLLVGLAALGGESDPSDLVRLGHQRGQAFSRFAGAYDGIRAALTYLFYKEDSGIHVAPAVQPRDIRRVRLRELERLMSERPREEWDPEWQAEFDALYED